MEDALAQDPKAVKAKDSGCLNPCCNGRCTRTRILSTLSSCYFKVLILVVMEDALALTFIPLSNNSSLGVLILVVMEDALAQFNVLTNC